MVAFLGLTSPTGRNLNADQVSSIDTMDTGRMPAAVTASHPTSRLMSVLMLEVFLAGISQMELGAFVTTTFWDGTNCMPRC